MTGKSELYGEYITRRNQINDTYLANLFSSYYTYGISDYSKLNKLCNGKLKSGDPCKSSAECKGNSIC